MQGVENELCLCQFGLYTGKSHILKSSKVPAAGTPSTLQNSTAGGDAQAKKTSRTQKIQAWGGLQNEIQSIICKNQEIIIPIKTSFGNYHASLKFILFILGFFLADGSAHTGS